jgi:hypothetical protein
MRIVFVTSTSTFGRIEAKKFVYGINTYTFNKNIASQKITPERHKKTVFLLKK